MSRIDFHQTSLEEALEKVHQIVGEVRLNNDSVEYRFITGNGIIKPALITILKVYGIQVEEEWTNSGVVRALIE
jgi:hypothetical protein